MSNPVTPNDFVPPGIDATRWEQIEPLLRGLREREVGSVAALERWLIDRSELEAACSEAKASLYINMTCDTDDAAAQAAYTRYVQEIPPRLSPELFELDRRQVELSRKFPLEQHRYGVLEQATRAEVELFRQENVPLETELALLSQKYDQIAGSMTVTFDGREQTLPQMAKY